MTTKKTQRIISELENAIKYVELVNKELKTLGSPLSHQRKLEDSVTMMKQMLGKIK
jgi:hypothetical protein